MLGPKDLVGQLLHHQAEGLDQKVLGGPGESTGAAGLCGEEIAIGLGGDEVASVWPEEVAPIPRQLRGGGGILETAR